MKVRTKGPLTLLLIMACFTQAPFSNEVYAASQSCSEQHTADREVCFDIEQDHEELCCEIEAWIRYDLCVGAPAKGVSIWANICFPVAELPVK